MTARRVDPGPERVRQLGGLWWLAVGLGVLSIIVGAVVLAKPNNSLKAFAVIAGIFILLDGIVELATAAASRGMANRGLAVLLGVLNLIVGILLIRHPIGGVQAVALFLGIWLIAAGVVRFVMTFDRPGKRLGRFVTAAIEALFGIVIVASPHIGFTTLAVLVGISFIAYGIAMIASGVLARTVKRDQRPRRRAAASSGRVRTGQ
ncbi:MAG: HdeD family acid-resistance protein [Solirubrobacteraceae bacterium]